MLSRRTFVSAAALSPWAVQAKVVVAPKVEPFPLRQVRLLAGSCRDAMEKNRAYLHDLEADRLLHTFRLNAGLPSAAEPLGGWESPDIEIRGHFTGHYLSACALMSQAAGDARIKAKADLLVAELARCQAKLGGGYLSAFPAEFFDRLRTGKKVWVPWYTYHKVLAGMLDMYTLAGNKQALEVAVGMGDWAAAWAAQLSEAEMANALKVEHGGMNEALFNLYAITGSAAHLKAGQRFNHEKIFAPLAAGRDELKGLHSNTQIPKIVGAARAYEVTGDPRYKAIATYFWNQVTGHRCYCTGGTSNREHWRTGPDELAQELSATTQECCCTYNLLRLTRQLYTWTGEQKYAEYYERALYNGIAGTMNPRDGMTMYYVPLAPGYWKIFGRPRDSFWCCTGSGVESFSKLADSIYFRDARGLIVNLYIPSELDWPEKRIQFEMKGDFPAEPRMTFAVKAGRKVRVAVRFRAPAWIDGKMKIRAGTRQYEAEPGTYCTVDREWNAGETLEIETPMKVRSQAMPDDPNLQAFLYGPVVLAGELGSGGLTPESFHGDPREKVKNHYLIGDPGAVPELQTQGDDPASWIQPHAGRPLSFETIGQKRNVTMTPLNGTFRQKYAVYWRIKPKP